MILHHVDDLPVGTAVGDLDFLFSNAKLGGISGHEGGEGWDDGNTSQRVGAHAVAYAQRVWASNPCQCRWKPQPTHNGFVDVPETKHRDNQRINTAGEGTPREGFGKTPRATTSSFVTKVKLSHKAPSGGSLRAHIHVLLWAPSLITTAASTSVTTRC